MPVARRSDQNEYLVIVRNDGKTYSRTISVSDAQRAVNPNSFSDVINYEILRAIKQIERESGLMILGQNVHLPFPQRIAVLDELWPDYHAAEV